MPVRVFVCYAHENIDWLERLHPFLTRALREGTRDSYELFWDRSLRPGEVWDETLARKIDEADLCILLGSAALISSEYVNDRELPRILRKEPRALFPVLLTTITAGFTQSLQRIQWYPSEGLAGLDETELDQAFLTLQDRLAERVAGLSRGLPDGGQALPGELAGIAIDTLKDLSEAPLLRMTVHSSGSNLYSIEIEARPARNKTFSYQNLRVRRIERPQQLCDFVFGHASLANVFAELEESSRTKGLPIRIQLVLGSSAYHLAREPWETLRWKDLPLAGSPQRVFSRQLEYPGAESGELVIKPRTQINYAGIHLEGAPAEVDPDITWSQPQKPGPRVRAALAEAWLETADTTKPELEQFLTETEVVLLALPAALGDDALREEAFVLLPRDTIDADPQPEPVSELGRTLEPMGGGPPSLLILPPRSDDDEGWINRSLAYHLSVARVPAVVTPVGPLAPEVWDRIAERLIADLKRHGTIDLAVATARQEAARSGAQILLYMRSKSARLWYNPGLVPATPRGPLGLATWDSLREIFRASDSAGEMHGCLALVGGNFDPELSWSRRAIAMRLARKSGFALSKRDAEDLGTVAEYIYISQDRSANGRPHVPMFVEETRSYLLKRFFQGNAARFRKESLPELARALSAQRLGAGSPFERLARLKVRAFLTVYFHGILELACDQIGRAYTSREFSLPDPGRKYEGLESFPTVERPLIYHCFGTFNRQENLLLSKSDYLRFFEEFCLKRDPLTDSVCSLLATSPILILGFRPSGDNLRILLAIFRQVQANYLAQHKLHIAVQVDPEDDHTIDPEGARDYYAGLVADLGANVLVFWGTPEEFFAELAEKCPEAFLEPRKEAR